MKPARLRPIIPFPCIISGRSSALALVMLLMVSFMGACEAETEPDAEEVPPEPLVAVDLPLVPSDLGQSSIPEKHADGSLTIDGLRRNRMAHLDQNVTVKGTIVWIYDCPHDDDDKKGRRRRKKPKKDQEEGEEKLCQRGHFYIADKADAEDRLLVVGLIGDIEEIFEEEKVKVGEQHTFIGKYADIGDGFAAPEEGLLHLSVIKGFEPEEDDK